MSYLTPEKCKHYTNIYLLTSNSRQGMPVREVDTHNLSTLMADGANKCVHLLARSPGM